MNKLLFKKLLSSPIKLGYNKDGDDWKSKYVAMKEFFEALKIGLKDSDKPIFKVASRTNDTPMNFPINGYSVGRSRIIDFTQDCSDDYKIISILGHQADWSSSESQLCFAYKCEIIDDSHVKIGRVNSLAGAPTSGGHKPTVGWNKVWVLLVRKDLCIHSHGGTVKYEDI